MITVDGSSGGGSILRITAALACSGSEPVKIINIRSKRPKPGLRPQHLSGANLIAKVSGSKLIGGEIGSTILEILPEVNEPIGHGKINLSTAASVSLIIQSLSNYILASKQNISFEFYGGGTHTKWSPNFDYLENTTFRALKRFGQNIEMKIEKSGFYPKGGAAGEITFSQKELPSVNLLKREDPFKTTLISIASLNLKKANVAERQVIGFQKHFAGKFDYQTRYIDSISPGSCITAFSSKGSIIKAGSSLGSRGRLAEHVGMETANNYNYELSHEAVVDTFLADQLLLALSFSPIGSYYTIPKLTNHVISNIKTINQIRETCLEVEKIDQIYRVSRK